MTPAVFKIVERLPQKHPLVDAMYSCDPLCLCQIREPRGSQERPSFKGQFAVELVPAKCPAVQEAYRKLVCEL